MDLCNALLLWYENQAYGSPEKAAVENPIYLFRKVSCVNSRRFFWACLFPKKILSSIIIDRCSIHVSNSDKWEDRWVGDCLFGCADTTGFAAYRIYHKWVLFLLNWESFQKLNLLKFWSAYVVNGMIVIIKLLPCTRAKFQALKCFHVCWSLASALRPPRFHDVCLVLIVGRLLGKYALNTFYTSSTTSSESDLVLLNSLIDLCGDFASKPVKDYLDFKPVIRLTNYLKVKRHTHVHTLRSPPLIFRLIERR